MAPPSATEGPREVTAVTDTQGVVFPNPLTLDGIPIRRTKAGRLVAGVAAASDIELFKGRTQHSHKPKAKRWDGSSSTTTLAFLPTDDALQTESAPSLPDASLHS